MNDCIFCKIIANEIPSEVILENDHIKVISDIHPKAPVHALILPKWKKHISSVQDIAAGDKEVLIQMILAAQKVAALKKLKGYKLVFNVGREGGQIIDHLHLHMLGGWSQPTHEAHV